jgi:hypothetical protein
LWQSKVSHAKILADIGKNANDSNLHLGLCVMIVSIYVTTPTDQSQGVLVPAAFLSMTILITLYARRCHPTMIKSTDALLLAFSLKTCFLKAQCKWAFSEKE